MMAAGLRLKPPGQCAETTEERSRPALTGGQRGTRYLASLLRPTTFLLGM